MTAFVAPEVDQRRVHPEHGVVVAVWIGHSCVVWHSADGCQAGVCWHGAWQLWPLWEKTEGEEE